MLKHSIFLLKFFSIIFLFPLPSFSITPHDWHKDNVIILPDDKRTPLIELIDNARESIEISAYTISDGEIINALKRAAERDVKIKFLIEPKREEHSKSDNIPTINQKDFDHKNVEFYYKADTDKQLHQKYCIFDDEIALIQTHNSDAESFDGTQNKGDPATRDFAIVVDDQNLIQQLLENFEQVSQHKAYLSQSNWNDERKDFLIFGPGSLRNDVIKFIKQATKTISIYQQYVDDEQIVDLLIEAVKRNIEVKMIAIADPFGNPKNSNTVPFKKLTEGGVEIHFLEPYYQHTKVIIIDAGILDRQAALVGSANFSSKSLDNHYETSIVTYKSKTIDQINQTFEDDFLQKK